MLKRCLISLLSIFILCGASKDINIKDITVEKLNELYKQHDYKSYIYMPKWQYPPIFLEKLPSDYDQIKSKNDRNKIFLMIMGPLALKLKQELLAERKELQSIAKSFKKNNDLSPDESERLEDFAQKYDVFSRLTGSRRYNLLITELLLRINVVPPSILMASAAINSDWGTSYPALNANNFYKSIEWNEDQGLPPQFPGEEKYNSQTYPSIYASMQNYALKINSGTGYVLFRQARKEMEYREKPFSGRELAYTMTLDSNLQNYAGILDYTITFYELINFDTATLK